MIDVKSIYVPGKEPHEEVLVAFRRHVMAISKKLTGVIFVGCFPGLAFAGVRFFTPWLDDQASLLYVVIVLLLGLFYLYILLALFHAWVVYYLDIWIITNERVIAIDQRGLFNRTVSELRLNRIQDVTSETKGFIPTLFKYGSIRVQTASEQDMFSFNEVPNPEIIARKLLDLMEHAGGSHPDDGLGHPMATPSPPANQPPPIAQ